MPTRLYNYYLNKQGRITKGETKGTKDHCKALNIRDAQEVFGSRWVKHKDGTYQEARPTTFPNRKLSAALAKAQALRDVAMDEKPLDLEAILEQVISNPAKEEETPDKVTVRFNGIVMLLPLGSDISIAVENGSINIALATQMVHFHT